MMIVLSTRRLRLCLVVVSACILLPVLGVVLFYNKGSALLLSREVLISKRLNHEQWQQRLVSGPEASQQPTANDSVTQLQQATDLHALTLLTKEGPEFSTVGQNLELSHKIDLWLQTTTQTPTAVTTTSSVDQKTTKNVLEATTNHPPRLHTDNKTHHQLQELLKKTFHHQSSQHKRKPSHGGHRTRSANIYVLALDYWDQQTSAMRNLLSLQCWAGHLAHRNVFVVEPFVINSRFGALPTTDVERQHQIKFQDMFDIVQWRKSCSRHTYGKAFAHLAPWSEFTLKAPKKAILVSISYTRYGRNCSRAFTTDVRNQCSTFLDRYKFQVIREVCIDMKDMTTKEFDARIFGKLSRLHGMTIIFSEWRGINADRINLADSRCTNGIGFVQVALNLRTSPRVFNDMKRYIQTYYGEEQAYTALVVRLEKLIINAEEGHAVSSVKQCLSKIFNQWSQLREKFGLKFTFLAMDYGKFGSEMFSKSYASQITSDIAESVEAFLRIIYGKNMTRQKWEESFKNVTNVTNSGYIALMQSTVAARAKCIVLAGGGTFQDHILHLYKQIPRSDHCYIQLSGRCHVTHSSIPKPKAAAANHIFES